MMLAVVLIATVFRYSHAIRPNSHALSSALTNYNNKSPSIYSKQSRLLLASRFSSRRREHYTHNVEEEDDDDVSNSVTADASGSTAGSSVEEALPTSTTRKPFRRLRTGLSSMISGIGFVTSATTALLTDRAQFRRWKPSVDALNNFLAISGIDLELSQSLNARLLDNSIVLGRIQKALLRNRDIRDLVLSSSSSSSSSRNHDKEEYLRYMRYATACYGEPMIRASELDVKGKWFAKSRSFLDAPVTRTRISEHIGVPENDIIVMDVDYDGDVQHLRHIVAVDHVNKKVVLSIRGTFSIGELVIDAAGFSRPFCGGEAHSEMANMAERVWDVAGDTVCKLLDSNRDYEFIITGHSLGGGTACLLNILCHQKERALVNGRKVRCFAYAAPPVYTPIEFASAAAENCINFIHERDVVPFLSVDTVRHFFGSVRAIDNRLSAFGLLKRLSYLTGYADMMASTSLIRAVKRASTQRLPPKAGAPILIIPAATNLWLREVGGSGKYDAKNCDSRRLAGLGIYIDPNCINDHLPSRYEHALYYLD